jgi:predicted ATPase
VLDRKGHNLASVLNRLERDERLRDAILEWMEMIVPGIEKIQTEQQQIDSKTAVLFKELGTRRRFPAHMVSDGTIYALGLLVAILDAPAGYGITLIEEPERGLHPKAIRELVGFVRQQAVPNNPIWLTTHSESIVRQLQLDELVLVDKLGGRTRMKAGDSGHITQENLAPLGLDEAWLSNLLDGGVPW